jgi:hypothetical protein
MTFNIERPVRLISFLATAGALLLCGCSQAAETASSSPRKVEVTDPQYQMTAYTLAVPANWKFGGAMVHQSDPCHTTGSQIKYTMLGPDGTSAVIMMPGAVWDWSADPLTVGAMVHQKCLPNDIHSAANFLVNIAVPLIHPNAKIVSVLPLTPEAQASVAAQLKSRLQQTSAISAPRNGTPGVKWNIDGARVRVEYTQNGKVVEEQLQSIIDCNETQGIAMPRQQSYMSRHCSARNIYIVRAPKGHLDELLASPLLENHNKSIQANNEWVERVTRDQWAAVKQAEAQSNAVFKQRMVANDQQFQAMVQRGRDFQVQQQASFESHMAAAEAGSDARQHAAHQQENLSLNQADFTDPNTGQKVTASNQYAHQWMSSDSSTLLQTNDPIDPNRSVMTNPASTTWTEITPDR